MMKKIKYILKFILTFNMIASSNNKYLRITNHFPYAVSDITNTRLFLENRPFGYQIDPNVTSKIYTIPKTWIYSNENDSFRIKIKTLVYFQSDSVPRQYFTFPKIYDCDSNRIFHDTIFYNFVGEKNQILDFKNDTADVFINWKMSDFEIKPIW
jgi:hypothetical protein